MRLLVEECCQLGLGFCDQVDDVDLWCCMYSLFVVLLGLMGEGLVFYLEQIIMFMLLLLCFIEGIVFQYDGSSFFFLFDDESDGEEEEEFMDEDVEEEDDLEILGYSVENVFFDEKEDICVVVGEIFVNISVVFFLYMESVFEEVFKLLECFYLNVWKVVYEVLGQFCCVLYKVC